MCKIQIGDKIRSISKKTEHIVESLETIGNQTVLFTEDIKCFPLEDIEKEYDSFVSEYFLKIFSGQKPTIEEEKKLKEIISKMFL